MKLVRTYLGDSANQLSGSVVTIGNFDGCHLGHQLLLEKTKLLAKELGLPAVTLSFMPLPHEFFCKDKKTLMSITEKYYFLQSFGLDYLYLLKFNSRLACLTPEQFVKEILCDMLQAKQVIVGEDFCFGHKRSGDVAMLQKLGEQYGFNVTIVRDHSDEFARISSSRLRKALAVSDFPLVNRLLGREYSIAARVVHGLKLGRTLGFPTVNIPLDRRSTPLHGIYAVRIKYNDKIYYGAASIGTRPAVNGKQLLLEVYIFDFNATIYGARIEVFFLLKIRDECNFTTLDALKEQISADVCKIKEYLGCS